MYAMEGSQLLWKGKPAKLASGATGRRITDTMATDGRTLHFAQKRVAIPKGINLDKLKMRVFNENTFNLFGAVLDDGNAVWHLNQRSSLEIHQLPGANFESVQPVSAIGIDRDYHVKDRHLVWYRGQVLEGLAAADAGVLGENIASYGKDLWIFGKRSNDLGRADLTPVWSSRGRDLVRTDDALLRLDAKDASITTVATASPMPPSDEAATAALKALGNDMFAVFEIYPQITVPIDDMDWEKVRAQPPSSFLARFEGPQIFLEASGIEPIRCAADGWYRGLCTLWQRLRGRTGSLITYPNVGTMLPSGHEFRRRLIKQNREHYLKLCGAVFSQGDAAGARLMLRAYADDGWYRQETPFDALEALVASLPRGLFEGLAYAHGRHGIESTTNLAVARHVIDSGLLVAADPRVRLEMLGLIHGAVIATDKTAQFFQHILPAIMARQEHEMVASITEHADTVVEAFIIAGLVHAEVRHQRTAETLEPIIHRQIERCVNVPLNRSRLIEVLIHQGRDADADAAITAFKADFGPGFMLPGLYANRPLYGNVDEAVAAMRQRAHELI
jgi:hypothetical protein